MILIEGAHVLRWIAVPAMLLLGFWVTNQVRKPTGLLGRMVARSMNSSHSTMTDWGLKHLPIERNATILDIGCGGGRTVQKLAARAPEGTVDGIDISNASVATARQVNADEIAGGRVRIERGSVASLPYPDRTFDIITAVETHYYWSDREADTREVLRVLKPGGTFAIIAETYRGGSSTLVYGLAMALIRAAFLTDAQHRELLTQAGFADVTTFHEKGTDWICAIGRRPS